MPSGTVYSEHTTGTPATICGPTESVTPGTVATVSVVPDDSRWATPADTNVTLICGTNNINVYASPATGYVCTECCPHPMPDTLYLTGKYGTIACVWGVYSFSEWGACVTVSEPESGHCVRCPSSLSVYLSNTGGDVTLFYNIQCTGFTGTATQWKVTKVACVAEAARGSSADCPNPVPIPTPCYARLLDNCPGICDAYTSATGCGNVDNTTGPSCNTNQVVYTLANCNVTVDSDPCADVISFSGSLPKGNPQPPTGGIMTTCFVAGTDESFTVSE